MRMQLGRWRIPYGMALAMFAGVVFSACCPKGPGAPKPEPGCPQGRAPETRAELDACLQNTAFDTSYEVIDEQPLAIISTSQGQPCPGSTTGSPRCRYGPLAKIQPLIGAHRYSDKQLSEGRIIAKISVPATEREGYPKYGLEPGQVTYWWVRTDASGRSGTSVFVTTRADGTLGQVTRRLTRYPDKNREYKDPRSNDPRSIIPEFDAKYPDQDTVSAKGLPGLRRAIVRWIWSLRDEKAVGKCGSGSCS